MTSYARNIVLPLLAAIAFLTCATGARAQGGSTPTVLERFVKTSDHGGHPSHDGSSWAQAKDNLQEAINDLRNEMQTTGVSEGRIYVAAGKYNPTESTEAQNSNILNTSFRVFEGITIYGGYPENPSDEGFDYTDREMESEGLDINNNPVVNPWNFKNKTVLSGNHSSLETSFTFVPARGVYQTTFPSSSYHVVWFATNGVIESATSPGHYRGLAEDKKAGIDGCIIEEGYASSRNLAGHDHMGFGGGAYLVANSFLRNCIVRRCQAAQRGGGVYMDGGGTVDHCFIHTCQTTGVAIAQGYGGGICIDYDGAVKYSHIAQCTARIGAGLAICHSPGEYPTYTEAGLKEAISPYMPYAVACIIANNTSNAEAGGVYLDEGGTLNHCTVVKNNCIGPDITYYGRRHGRSGGVYVRNRGMIYNSVFWGSKCKANSDIQFASIMQSAAEDARIDVFHSAFYNQDITDWSNVIREEVFSLASYNRPHRASGTCCWFEVNRDILGEDGEGSLNTGHKAGVDYNETTMAPLPAQVVTTWRPRHMSDLAMKGVQVSQNVHVNSEWIRHAHTAVDILGQTFELSSTLGAIAHIKEDFAYSLMMPQGKEGRAIASPSPSDSIPTIFVDAQRDHIRYSQENFYGPFGSSWDYSAMLITDAVNYFEQHRIKTGANKDKYQFGDKLYDHVQILVKEGVYNTAGEGNYEGNDIRTASVKPKSNMRIYGGYPTVLKRKQTDSIAADGTVYQRDPGAYHSLLSCNIVGSYENNSAHSLGLINVHDVIIDGLRLVYGNVVGMETSAIVKKGTGLIVSNTTIDQDERIDMTGNVLRNSIVANTQSYDGAAFYVNALMPKANDEIVKAELTVENTVIRNCTSLQDDAMLAAGELPGVVVANGRSTIRLDHCTIVNNVGYPLKTREAAGYTGQIKLTNSVLFANSDKGVADRENITKYVATVGTGITGHHNMIDGAAEENSTLETAETNQYNLSMDRTSANYPTFKNPSFNVGHSEGVDRPLYGGMVSYEPLNKNPIVNAADEASMARRDRTDINYFDYGGAADIGAIENTSLPKNGTVLYVTPDGAGRRDGSSWGNAIQGNAIYALNGATAAGTDQLDETNGTTRIINSTGDGTATTGAADGVLTTDNRYQGGFALYNNVTANTYLTSNSDYYYTETNTYTGGGPWDKVETVRDNEHEHVEVTDQLIEDGIRVTDERAANPAYPYGELSGASRTFWRANPYEGDAYSFANRDAFLRAVGENNWINNDRKENYVSGLQYAVETASAYNTLPTSSPRRSKGVDSVMVWVSNGKYTDYKGFIMRDKTTVMGSFPAIMQDGTLRTPGLNERQALMSALVNIPKAKQAKDYDPVDYETILQISDTNPKKSNTEINPDAIHFYDKDESMSITTRITQEEHLRVTLDNQYVWDTTPEDWTGKHIAYPELKDASNKSVITNNPTPTNTEEGFYYYTFGSATDDKDCWHMSVPTTSAIKKSELIKEGEFTMLTGESNVKRIWFWPHDATLTGLSFWQTMKNVAPGNYQIEVDLGGGYRGTGTNWGSNIDSNKDTNIHFYIIDSQGNTVTDHMVVNTGGREKARHHTFTFTQEVEGPLTVKLYVGEGLQSNPSNKPDGTSNPNRREAWITNLKLTKLAGYTLAGTNDTREEIAPTERTSVTTIDTPLATGTELSTLRKRVLTMPDVTVPTYGAGTIGDPVTKTGPFGDEVSHRYRITGPTKALRKAPKSSELVEDPNYVEYSNVYWNGFTIRHGFIKDECMAHGGGAGVSIYEGAHLQNCIITDNFAGSGANKGGGVFCDGATSTVEGCFILNNTSTKGLSEITSNGGQVFAGGFFLYEGTCYNTLIANNYSCHYAGGLGLCVGNFFNNTVAYNTSGKSNGGIRIATGAESAILMANTIIYGNDGAAITMTESANYSPFIHCYIQSKNNISSTTITSAINAHTAEGDGNYGVENTFLNNVAPNVTNTPFAADVVDGAYTGNGTSNNAKTNNDFQLRKGFNQCINSGSIDFEADMIEGFKLKKPTYSENDIKTKIDTKPAYEAARDAVLPLTDVAFADRVQDCSIDIGAYEYNGAVDIEPDTLTFKNYNGQKLAVYYVTENGFEAGDASANSPENAACALKLQKVLDAAGRWKYARAQGGASGYPDSYDLIPVVALGGNGKTQAGNFSTFAYTPERSTKTGTHDDENVLDYSLIIPHGVQLWGGFFSGTGTTPGFYEEDGEGNATMLRDILRYPTYISGNVVSETGATGQAHHVINFTNDLFDINEDKIDTGGQLELLSQRPAGYDAMEASQKEAADAAIEANRAVIDGLFIKDGYANGAPAGNGSVTEDMCGAAAIVTSFAHVRNCIITDNRATGYGGGLYMEPHALLSGTVVKNNEAQRGGGIYVDQPTGTVGEDTYAFILTSTVVGNNATERGGGLVFQSNLRANSSVFWHNLANDKNNVSGNQVQSSGESASISTTNYPLVYCGIEVVRWEGVNNLLISANETEGVRWDHLDYYERYHGAASDESLYYPIEMSSVLARAGMTYTNYQDYCNRFPTLDLTDMAGMKRMENDEAETVVYDGQTAYVRKEKDNALIEMGARVVNTTYKIGIDPEHIMTRLYVVHTEDLASATARMLQDNGYVDDEAYKASNLAEWNRAKMYSQMGSCFANPFHRLGDALEYIIDVRKSTAAVTINGENTTLQDYYRNKRFEIFLTNGTFYPYRNAYGRSAASRSNTFVIPEKVSLIGGVNNEMPYGQLGYGETGTDGEEYTIPVKDETGVTLESHSTQAIRRAREQSDLNMNNVVEPWELNSQSLLSGNVVSGTETKNVYHVITCYSDPDQLGLLPQMFSDNALQTVTTNRTAESHRSQAERTIFIDGVTILNGYANDISDEDKDVIYQQQTYYRGGGILVEGNWDHVSETGNYVPDVLGVANRDIPMVVANCMFQDNMAGNGGGIYSNGSLTVTGCHFVQNLSRGPNTETDQRFIPWTAGGAIATNYDCTVVNTIFANNEAQRGKLPITIEGNSSGNASAPGVEMADIRQGFGGVISSSETSTVHALNCDFVRNKAVAFPAIYNFLDQNQKQEKVDGEYKWEKGDCHHWAVNCLFWGNEANTSPSDGGQVDSYTGNPSNDPDGRTLGSLFTVAPGKTARKRADVANFGIDDRSLEVCYFCAYEEDYGLPSNLLVIADDDHKNDHKKCPVTSWTEFGKGAFMDNIPDEWKDTDGNAYTHNQYLDKVNDALNGPSFILPSTQAGISGYMQNADWLVNRLNRIIDNGWSYLPQHVTISNEEEDDGNSIDVFNTIFEHTDEHDNGDGTYSYDSDPMGEMDNTTLRGSGIYNFFSLQMDAMYGPMGMMDLATYGEHPYMKYDRFGESSGMSTTMRRISTYPKLGEQEVYIDIGVYEYQYVQLFIPGNAYDVIWVRPDNPSDGSTADGTTWAKATNNVQQALDMLMSSHNDHDKVLKVRSGDYSPIYLTHGKLSYYIEHDENPNTVLYPSNLTVADYLGVNSITIRGGYPNDEAAMIPDKEGNYDGEAERDPELYPTRFVMSGSTGYEDMPEVKENLFIIRNMERQEANKNFIDANELDYKKTAVPVSFEGITFSNPYAMREGNESADKYGGAILYTEQHKKNVGEGESPLLDKPKVKVRKIAGGKETYVDADAEVVVPKLLIKDCVFLANSTQVNADKEPTAAVHILDGGGDAVIANSLFHSNGGNPVEAVNTKVVNCTFALNEGQLTLTTSDNSSSLGGVKGSKLHNSIIWRDALHSGVPYNLADGSILGNNNAITDYTPVGDEVTRQNVSLSRKNSDILLGPNFTKPLENGTNDNSAWLRDMHPRPSDLIISKADSVVYRAIVPYYDDTSLCTQRSMKVNGITKTSTIQTVARTMQKTDTLTPALWRKNELDLAWMPRFTGKGLERGPYEVVTAIQRVLYMNPVNFNARKNDGSTWDKAFGAGHLQDAIDAAGVYSATNGGRRAYVFLRGDGITRSPAIQVRDGVTVYGGVASMADSVLNGTYITGEQSWVYKEKEIFDYINRVRASRSGVASTNSATASLLAGVMADGSNNIGDSDSSGFVLDGFHITNGLDKLGESPVMLHDDRVLLRNCLIFSNDLDDDHKTTTPIVDISKGLLYNTLVYDNQASTVVQVGSDATGGVLNCTVVADDAAQKAIASETANRVVNTITYNEATKGLSGDGTFAYCNTKTGMFAPYLRNNANSYDYPFGDHVPFWYQLHEQSDCINAGTNDWASYFSDYSSLWEGLTGGEPDPDVPGHGSHTAQKFIDFAQDRDVLGNPRRIDQVDMGAFETWRVKDDETLVATNETNSTESPVSNYGGHYYPHLGSVAYIGNNAALRVKEDNFTTVAHALMPSYLLVKEGGSLYGQGNHVRVPYVATEHTFADGQPYALFSLPYDWSRRNIGSVSHSAETDALTDTPYSLAVARQQTYDGDQRAKWDYGFQTEDSPCWTDTSETVANEGYLLTLDADHMPASRQLRFTAWGETEAGAPADAYTEDGTDKTVALAQHDEMPTDGKAHFTPVEGMGWNLKGMPWLVSGYKTYAIDGDGLYDAGSQEYQMDVPHLFYTMAADGSYEEATAGSIYSRRSWDNGSVLSPGDAYFTQTAILGSEEQLTFRLPVYAESPSPVRPLLAIGLTGDAERADRSRPAARPTDVVELRTEGSKGSLSYHEGSDALKWMAPDERLPQLFAVSSEGIGMSLMAHTPLETDIPLRLRPSGDQPLSLWLPRPEAFSSVEGVWLTDHLTGTVTNLMENDYTLTPTGNTADLSRLTLRLGSRRQDGPAEGEGVVTIGVVGRTLHVGGLSIGQQVAVYNVAGQLYRQATATDSHYATRLNPGIYVVHVGTLARRVLVR